MSQQCPKTTRCKLCCENLGTSHDVKSFAILAQKKILEHFVVKKISTKSAVFYQLFFGEVK